MGLDKIKTLEDAAQALPEILDNLAGKPEDTIMVSAFTSFIIAYDESKRLLSRETYDRAVKVLKENGREDIVPVLEKQVEKHNYFSGEAA